MPSYVYVKMRDGQEVGTGHWAEGLLTVGQEIEFDDGTWVVKRFEDSGIDQIDQRVILEPK